ncbi:hypothetical protein ACFOLJ_22485 [Rugamonas sp. CCM 8940]|uniref:hypothetical protein n=1 Tax=Rugamonas sp. CCM 8940 TaxID=2765359 RepID=UPI0018F4F9E2|nr:hypothetical protein [Rugamonas sp. CCM 8940]MBJ7311492.1 hypothetical protein [Rugamonas sp. CCM 8940]
MTTIDEAGRLQEAKTEYHGFKTVLTNARQFTRTELRNVVGQMKKVTDANGSCQQSCRVTSCSQLH